MSEWWTYRPSDFLMFSARAYGRLVESYNREVWPLQLPMIVAGLAITWYAARPHARSGAGGRGACIVLALAWLWVGWAFHWQRFTQINTAAPWFAWAFMAQSALLVLLWRAPVAAGPTAMRRRIGAGLCAAAVMLYPLVAPLTGRPWAHAELFGSMPDPTALATLGLLLAAPQPHGRLLAAIPTLWLAIASGTAWLLWAQ